MLYFLLINYGFITDSSCMILGTSIALNSTYQLPSSTEGTPKELRRFSPFSFHLPRASRITRNNQFLQNIRQLPPYHLDSSL